MVGGSRSPPRLAMTWCVVLSLSFLLFCTPMARAQSWKSCNGTVGGCGGEETEWLVDSHAARRILQGYNGVTKKALNSAGKPVFDVPRNKPYGGAGCNAYNRCRVK